jgi:PAS domain S-box-containing protein
VRLLAAFLVLVALVLFVGVASFRINEDVRADVAELRASDVFDLRTVDLESSGIEVEGFWNPDGSVVATDIKIEESSPRPRLRGAIQSLDPAARTLTLFGRTIQVDAKTEDDTEKPLDFARLTPGMRVEASCNVEDGVWRARKIELEGVKNSDQIKGLVTQKELDGVRPESVEIHGLRIVVEPAPHADVANALARIGKATQMFTALHDVKTRAHDLVTSEGGTVSAGERLVRAAERLSLIVDQAHGEAGDPFSAPPSGFLGPVRQMKRHMGDVERLAAQLSELAPLDPPGARRMLEAELDPVLEQLTPSVSAYLSEADDDLGDQLRGVLERTETTTRIALVTSLVAVVVAFVLGFFVWRSIDQPIQALREAARNLGAGRLDTRIALQSHREFGELADAFNRMASELSSTTVSMESLATVFDSMAAALIVFDPEGRIVNVNRATCDLVGRSREELVGQTFDVLCRFSAGERIGPNVPARGGALSVEKVFVRKDGSEFPVSFSGAELRASGGPLSGYVCVAQDLSEQKAIQERLRESLSEKELLLREVHHRVKNNMQVISSLLAMQSTGGDAAVAKKLEESQNRIRSIALIHEQLYRSTELEEIDARTYLESLTSQLVQSFGVPHVTLELEVAGSLTLDIDQSMACGLIVNELVTNAVKYAFPDGRPGTIRVALREDGGERLLEVGDDGRGMESPQNGPSKSLGMSLVATLARQLRGRAEIDGSNGTRVRVRFPRRTPQEASA